MRKLTRGAVIVLLLWLAAGAGAAHPVLDPARPPASAVDVDADRIVDSLEARLGEARARELVDVVVTLDGAPTPGRIDVLGGLAATPLPLVDGFAASLRRDEVRRLAALPGVRRVEEDAQMYPLNDSAQEAAGVAKARLDAPGLDGDHDGNADAYSGADLVAAVLDTGIDATHADLDEGKVLAAVDCLSGACVHVLPSDANGHGTHVAATIAGDGDARSDRLFRGVAPSAALLSVRVLPASGPGSSSAVISGLSWVVANKEAYGIEAINLSLGAGGCWDGTDAVSQAVNAAHAAGLVVAVAAGNDGPGTCTVGSPGAAAGALTVGAMADTGVPVGAARSQRPGFILAPFSSRGPTADGRVKPDIVAPGVDITSADAGTVDGYSMLRGTSMAAPFVAGVALLMRDANPALTSQQVKDKLMATAVDWGRGGTTLAAGSSGSDIDFGAGRLDAYAALRDAGAPLATPPLTPTHVLREGAVNAGGSGVDHRVDVASTQFPIAATVIGPLNVSLSLLDPNGSEVASSSGDRQAELGYRPVSTGAYTVRVRSTAAGAFALDLSAGIAPQSALSVTDATTAEGDAGTVNAVFTIHLVPASPTPERVLYSTTGVTAAAVSDFGTTRGAVVFNPGETQKTIAVPVTGDPLDEPDETFQLALSNSLNALVLDGQATGTITDDDVVPSARTGAASSIGNVSAKLNGTVNPSNKSTTYVFEFGRTTGYGSKTPRQIVPVVSGDRTVSASVAGLLRGVTYHYRLVATNATGTTNGADRSFTTETIARGPLVVGRSTLGVSVRSVRVTRKKIATIPIRCTGSRCVGVVALDARVNPRLLTASGRADKLRRLRLGSNSFRIPAGRVTKVRIKLNRDGMRALVKARKLRATITVFASDGKTYTKRLARVVVLRAPAR